MSDVFIHLNNLTSCIKVTPIVLNRGSVGSNKYGQQYLSSKLFQGGISISFASENNLKKILMLIFYEMFETGKVYVTLRKDIRLNRTCYRLNPLGTWPENAGKTGMIPNSRIRFRINFCSTNDL